MSLKTQKWKSMSPRAMPTRQRGATLIIGLILMALITLIMVNAFNLSASNAKSVSNMQLRNEAISAANQAIELVISSAFTQTPTAQSINVDMNKNDSTDYVVQVALPRCLRAIKASSSAPSDVELPTDLASGATWNTDWEIEAEVVDLSSRTKVVVKQGVRMLLTDAQKTLSCA